MPERPPLKPEVFEILAALAEGDLHGYAILKTIGERGAPMVASLLYRKLHRLLEYGWVAEVEQAEPERDQRRRYYRLTVRGRAVLEEEARRIVELAGSKRVRRIAAGDAATEGAGGG
jgi:DNA-binding PadR family transcriptional regulator